VCEREFRQRRRPSASSHLSEYKTFFINIVRERTSPTVLPPSSLFNKIGKRWFSFITSSFMEMKDPRCVCSEILLKKWRVWIQIYLCNWIFTWLHCLVLPLWGAVCAKIRENMQPLLCIGHRHKMGNRMRVQQRRRPWFPSAPARPHNENRPCDHTHVEAFIKKEILASSD